MPVYQMMDEMPYTEFRKWITFFKERPVGWREDYRAYMIMSTFGYKGKPEQAFASIAALKKAEKDKIVNDRAVPKGKFLNMMLNAVGGDGQKFEVKGK